MVAFEQGAFDEAISDLTEALRIAGEDPDLLFNRGFVFQRTHRWEAALRDYSRAMELPGVDMPALLYQRGLCHAEASQTARSRSDLEACIRLGEGSVAQEAQAYLDALVTSGGDALATSGGRS
jgi:tetratricopeptide (TPR) repeat protein